MAESSKTTASDQSPCENRSMNSSAVWQHFKKVEGSDGKIKSVCDFCRKSYSLSSSTTNLKKHLITAHSKDIKIAKLAKKATVVKKKYQTPLLPILHQLQNHPIHPPQQVLKVKKKIHQKILKNILSLKRCGTIT